LKAKTTGLLSQRVPLAGVVVRRTGAGTPCAVGAADESACTVGFTGRQLPIVKIECGQEEQMNGFQIDALHEHPPHSTWIW
jgi:hypothetical protein